MTEVSERVSAEEMHAFGKGVVDAGVELIAVELLAAGGHVVTGDRRVILRHWQEGEQLRDLGPNGWHHIDLSVLRDRPPSRRIASRGIKDHAHSSRGDGTFCR